MGDNRMDDKESLSVETKTVILDGGPDSSWMLVGLEKVNHTRWVDQHRLPGDAIEKMYGLQYWHKRRLGVLQRVMMYLLCRQFFIGIGTFGPLSSALEAQAFHETQFETFERSDVLTRGFGRPHSLIDEVDLFDRLPNFEAASKLTDQKERYRHILVVGHELDRTRAFFAFTLAAILTLGVGIGVGAAKHHVGLGATIGATVFGCLAIVQVAIIWTIK